MYTYVVLCVLAISSVSGEPPRYNSGFSNNFRRLEAAPYPPSGWRPSGPQFQIPEPQSSYGPPPQEYGTPEQEYGPPEAEPTTTSEPESTTTEVPTTTANSDIEEVDTGSGDYDQQNEALKNEERGVYYIYHPNGLLQKVNFATQDDVKQMAFSAKLQYENVEPVRGPVFTYDPVTFAFRRLR